MVVGETHSRTVNCAEDTVLLTQVVDDLLLVSVDPARDKQEEEKSTAEAAGRSRKHAYRAAPVQWTETRRAVSRQIGPRSRGSSLVMTRQYADFRESALGRSFRTARASEEPCCPR